jgi:predicted methyltransferase
MKFIHTITWFGALTLLVGCKVQEFETIKFKTNKRTRYYIDVPRKYSIEITGGSHGEEMFKFTYGDSSIIYITTFTNTPNYEEIREQKGSYYKKFDAQGTGDTLLLEGMSGANLHWKNKVFGRLSLGYKNVSEEKKKLYEQVLSTFRRKRRRK